MSRFILPLLIAAAMLAIPSPAAASHGSRGYAACHEDEPCWNWATMGNHRRGIVTMYGTPRVVSVCAFQRLMRAGLIDYPRAQRMRGDASAMRYRCTR